MSILDKIAVQAARFASHSPYGCHFVARNLAHLLPGLRNYPLHTRYGVIRCDLRENVCLPLLRHGEYPHFRPEEADWDRIPLSLSSVVLDIGANIGVMTRIFARRAGHVHAFEPAPRAMSLLIENTKDRLNVTVHHVAISNRDGTTHFAERPNLDVSSISSDGIEVPTRTIDSLGLDPDFIKIDVEGYEHLVLEGASETLKRSPIVMFEALSETARQYCENLIVAVNPGYRFETIGWGTNHIAWPVAMP